MITLQEPFYVNAGHQLQSKKIIKKWQRGKQRWYFIDRLRKPAFFLSVTSFCHKIIPHEEYTFLMEWKLDRGRSYEQDLLEAAHYGTLMHDTIQDFLLHQKLNWDDVYKKVRLYFQSEEIPTKYIHPWIRKLESDLIAFGEFAESQIEEIIAIEYPIVGTGRLALGGRIDLVAKIKIEEWGYFGEVYKRSGKNYNAGDPKLSKGWVTYNAIVDFKSGRKGFYASHELQLECYKRIWALNFEKTFNVEKVFNWRPKEWRSQSTDTKYTLKDQTNAKFAEAFPNFYGTAKKLGYLSFNGNIKLVDEEFTFEKPISEQWSIQGLSKYIHSLKSNKNESNS